MHDVAILGSGPAGLTAAIYAARANLATLVLTGDSLGGQIATTYDVENYPGFEEITGPDLTMRMQGQAERFGAEIVYDQITEVDFQGPPFTLTGRSATYHARAVIVATGASPRLLGIPGEQDLWGRGVSVCATCDGAFFRDQPVAVVGGGDSALQEGLFLTRFASRVTVIHRRNQLRAGPYLRDRARAEPKIDFIWDTVVAGVQGDQAVQSLSLKNVQTGQESEFPTEGLFIFIGHDPNTEIFKGKLEMDEDDYVISNRYMHTNVQGVFVAGEAQDHYFRQAITSAGEGCQAAMEAEKFIARLKSQQPAEAAGVAGG